VLTLWKKVLLSLGILVVVAALGGGAFVLFQVLAFDASMNKDYGIEPLDFHASTDPAIIARGKHLAEANGGCMECHGSDLGGKPSEDLGPIGSMPAANLTSGNGGVAGRYSDGQLARLLRHGLRDSGKSLRFMPAQDISWWPDDDVEALISFLRTLPPVDRTMPDPEIGLLGKVLDRVDAIPLDVARRIDHAAARPKTLPPEPTAAYGANLARSCKGCHGEHFSGGPIPGAPAEMPVPANITPHESGIAAATEADWNRLLDTGIKRDGKPLDPFMPIAMLRAMDASERSALWKFLKAQPALPFGQR
jgi:cytochrome c553